MSEKAHFDINAAVVRQLGEELVSDEITALIELVKNAYDADASYAKVVVDTNSFPEENLYFSNINNQPSEPGYILIEDDGFGMDSDEIEKGWLTISFSSKRIMRREGILTPIKKRTPLGEKGLGRLSSQRLGNRLEMLTTKDSRLVEKNTPIQTCHVAFDWNDFSEEKSLSAVPVYFSTSIKDKAKNGTKLIVTNLRQPEVWSGKESQQKLVGQLSQLLFPFEEVRPFNVFLSINGIRFDLDTLSSSLRNVSPSQFSFSYDEKTDNKIRISGKIKLSRIKGLGIENEEVYNQLIVKDQGKSFFNFLTDNENKFSLSDIKYLGSDGWFFSFWHTLDVNSIGSIEFRKNGEVANPGKFSGEINEFFFRGVNLDPMEDIFSKLSEYRDFVKQYVGIRIYRDGFGIRPYGFDGDDWLKLGGGQTSGRSFYGLRPGNVIGYVSLTACDNKSLKEKTDREGFIDDPYYRNFKRIMDYICDKLNMFYNNLQRSYNEYKKSYAYTQDGQIFSDNVFEEIRQTSSSAKSIEEKVNKLDQGLDQIRNDIYKRISNVKSTPLLATEEERNLSPILSEAGKKLTEAQSLVSELQNLLARLKNLETRAIALEAEMEILEDQLNQFSELAGLGLTAEALSHEIHTVADQLAERTKVITSAIKNKNIKNSEIVTYTEYVHTAISALRKQLSHLAPSLRYVRDTKDQIKLHNYFTEIQKFYTGQHGRFANSKISISLEKPFDDFSILINKGKLTQIVDNLILNSEYWLKEMLRRKEINSPNISIRSKSPFISISDNGRGIDPSIESSLFQPFVTTKPKNIGRGLGLFIVRELLDSSGCSIMLLPDKNQYNHRYIFRIDFSGVLDDNQQR